MHPEHVARLEVGTGDGVQLDRTPVLPVTPIDDERLPVDGHVHLGEARIPGEQPIAVGSKGHALPVDEVDFVVDRLLAEARNLGDAPDGHLVDQQREDFPILVRLALPGCRLCFDREDLPAGIAPNPLRACGGFTRMDVVAWVGLDGNSVFRTTRVRAGRRRFRVEIADEPQDFFGNRQVATEG